MLFDALYSLFERQPVSSRRHLPARNAAELAQQIPLRLLLAEDKPGQPAGDAH
ncbi:MAG: hypothetical protein U1E71_05500 [Ramlibacter sp.]